MEEPNSGIRFQGDTLDALSTLRSVQHRGVSVWVENGQLRFRSPKGALGGEQLHNLRRFKEEIICLLRGDTADSDTAFTHRTAGSATPLTPLQRLIWTEQCGHGGWTRSHALVTQIQGNLLTDVLASAVRRAAMRHEILRTRISVVDAVPMQSVDECRSQNLKVVDLTGRQSDAQNAVSEFLGASVSIDDPLFESRLFRLAGDEFVLAVSLDALITDCRSDDLLSRQIWDDYVGIALGILTDTVGEQLQFGDYAAWHVDYFPRWQTSHASYWRNKFSEGISPRLGESHDTQVRQWTSENLCLEPAATSQLIAFAQQCDVYPAIVMLTAYIATVAFWWRCSDITIAAIDNGRFRPELQTMLGPLVHHLYLRVQMHGCLTFSEALQAVTTELQTVYQHRDFNWLPSILPGVRAELYFNWITHNGPDALPAAAQTAAAGINVNLHPLQRSGLPAAPNGLTLWHSQQVTGKLTHQAGMAGGAAEAQFSDLLHTVWSTGIRRPELRLDAILPRVP